jgi:hypothetical protein
MDRVNLISGCTITAERPAQALAIANKAAATKGPDAAENRDLFRSTHGLMFFGVPNMGLRHKQLITMVDKQRLITDLVVDRDSEPSRYLAELTQKFIEVCGAQSGGFEIVSYYERKPSSTVEVSDRPLWLWEAADDLFQQSQDGNLVRTGEPELLVTEESARRIGPGDNYCRHVPLSTDHRGLVRFDSDSDPNYLMVKSAIKTLVERAPSAVCMRFSVEEGL